MLEELKLRSDKEMLHEFFVKFPNHLRKVIESKESAIGDAGCLLVMGVDDSDNPADYFISYVREDARWVFDEMTISYAFDGEKRVVTDPICDQEKREILWLEYMQGQHN